MKSKYFTTFFVLLILVAVVRAQTWSQVSTPTDPSISSSFFLFSNIGWYVGDDGLVKKTIDGGVTWTTVTTGITEDLESVYFINNNLGFVGCSGTKIYKTTNGGNSWTPITVTGAVTGSSNIVSLYFADEQKGWVVSSTSSVGKILQTIDGGTTWTVGADNPAGDLEAMHFYNATSGIVVGGGAGKCDLYYTKDGTTWTKATAPTFPAGYTRNDIKGVFMLDQNLAYATGWGSLIGAQASIQLKTLDGGATWTYLPQSEDNKTFDNMYGLYFKDENNGIAIGGAIKGSVAVRTTDGGINWAPINIPCGSTLYNISGFGNNLIVTSSSAVLSSTDFGNTWNLLTAIPSSPLYSVSVVNNDVIYAGGYDGLVLKSKNAGKTWEGMFARANNVCPNIQALHFVNENVGYTVHSYGMIAKTTDGGMTWSQAMKDTTASAVTYYGVYFVNANLGFVVGKVATNVDVIHKTTNGGTTWETKTGTAATTFRGVAFIDAQKGVVVGDKLKAVYTTDGGTTWKASTFNNVPSGSSSANLREVVFLNNTNVLAVGDKIILSSTDGGATFNYVTVSDLEQSLNGVCANSATNAWTIGAKSSSPKSVGLFQTTDGGQTWTNKVDNNVFDVNGSYYDITITPSGYVFVTSGSSTIYTNSPLTDVRDDEAIILSYSLSQNYPNPFNPSTKINYTINQAGIVKLNVYDVLGRLVKSLVNEYQNPGNHSIQFDASSLSSGTYIYSLSINNSIISKKMILVK